MGTAWLVGFMGAGKTSVGKELARVLGRSFVDLDAELSARFGLTIREFFSRHGEPAFRAEETEMVRRFVGRAAAVVATGGGTFCVPANRELIHAEGGASVFLDVPWPVILRRLPGKNVDRPMFGDPEQARALYELRRPHYQLARLCIAMSGEEPPEEVARKIAALLMEAG